MKKLIALAFVSALALSTVASAQQQDVPEGGQRRGRAGGAAARQAAAPAAKILTAAEFDALLKEPSKLLIIDVRRPDEISANGGFPVYLSIQLADLDKSLDYIPKDRTIVTVSNHASRGGRAAAVLAGKGFNVAGGIGSQTYEEEGGKAAVHVTAPAPRAGRPGAAAAPVAGASDAR